MKIIMKSVSLGDSVPFHDLLEAVEQSSEYIFGGNAS